MTGERGLSGTSGRNGTLRRLAAVALLGGIMVRGAEPSAETVTVTKEPFAVHAVLEGIVAPAETVAVALDAAEWKEWVLERATPHGSRVTAGQELVAVETEGLDRAIAAAESALALKQVAAQEAEEALRAAEAMVPLEVTEAERGLRVAREDLQRFTETERPLRQRNAELTHERARFRLEYAEEELRQLEAMYREDEMVEATEELVIRRQRRQVDWLRFDLEQHEDHFRKTTTVLLPREDEQLRAAARQGAAALAARQATAATGLKRRRLEMADRRREAEEAAERLARLRQDRAAVPLRAPLAGRLYWGRFEEGAWKGPAPLQQAITEKGGALPRRVTLMTIVPETPPRVRVTVPAEAAAVLRQRPQGATISCLVSTAAHPRIRFAGTLSPAAMVPGGQGGFSMTAAIPAWPQPVAPGVAATVVVALYEADAVVAVPAAAIAEDPERPDQWSVTMADGSRRSVAPGRSNGVRTEIRQGLNPGDVVLRKHPKE